MSEAITERFSRFNSFIQEDRIIRGQWHGTDKKGREAACLLGAFGDDINEYSKCPAEIMPSWLARLTVNFDDNGSLDKWPAMVKRYADVANRWHVLETAAWDICLSKTLRAALLIAEPHDKANVVRPVIALLDRQIAGDKPSKEEWQKARAAAAAVYAAAADDVYARQAAWDKITDACLTAIEEECAKAETAGMVEA